MFKNKITAVITLLIIIVNINTANAIKIYSAPEFEAGLEYNIEAHTNAKNVTAYLEILDNDGRHVQKKTEMRTITQGAYTYDIIVPANEDKKIYILKVTITDGINTFENEKIVTIKKITWYKRLYKILFENILRLDI